MRKISWVKLGAHISDLTDQIVTSAYQPTVLAAIARGGWIPTRLLSDRLSVRKIISIGIAYDGKERTKPNFYSIPTPIYKNDSFLVIEDKLETGRSMIEAVNFLRSKKALVKTASLFITQNSIITPDYYLATIEDEVIFPWENY